MRSHLIVMFPLLLVRASEEVKHEKEARSRTIMAEKRDSISISCGFNGRKRSSYVRRKIKPQTLTSYPFDFLPT